MTRGRDPEDPDYINPDPDNWNWNWDPEVNDYVYVNPDNWNWDPEVNDYVNVNPDNEDPEKYLCSY